MSDKTDLLLTHFIEKYTFSSFLDFFCLQISILCIKQGMSGFMCEAAIKSTQICLIFANLEHNFRFKKK